MNPARSFVGTVSFPRLAPNCMPVASVSSEVVTQRTTSSSFITWAGIEEVQPEEAARAGRGGRLRDDR